MQLLSDHAERIAAGVILLLVVAMQISAAITSAIQSSAGRLGRLFYYIAFALVVIHECFIAFVVPGSLVWASVELILGSRGTDALLAAIVGSLWYGPDRVQSAGANLFCVVTRIHVIRASLGEYHRAAVDSDEMGVALTSSLVVKRRLRLLPCWSPHQLRKIEYWHGRVVQRQPDRIKLADEQLRVIARQGIEMAISGNFNELSLRVWCAGMIADQARYDCSLLTSTSLNPDLRVLGGLEGRKLKESFDDNGKEWDDDELHRLAYIAEGLKKTGLEYARTEKWLE